MSADWHDLVSQPKYNMKVKKDVAVPVRGGVHMAADIYYPDAPGKFPALISISPYGKEIQKLPIGDYPNDTWFGNGGIEAGQSEYFVSRGYVHIIADSPGTGHSTGAWRVFKKSEFEAGADLVEWAARQPWCNSNVGMIGMSYFAMIQYGIAAERPPHLRAIFPFDGLTDIYRHFTYHGGILCLSFFLQWWAHILGHTFAPSDLQGAELERMVEAKKNDPDIQRWPNAYIALCYPEKNQHLYDLILHPHDGPFYWERSGYTKLDKINIPCHVLSRWTAWSAHLPGAFTAYQGIQAPKKLTITMPESGVGFGRPWHEGHDLILRWYDHWLKGIDTGVMTEPPIEILVQGTNTSRHECEWPLARTKWTKFYLRNNLMLDERGPGSDEQPDRVSNKPGLKPGQPVPCLKFATAPLTEELEVTGPIALYLYASLDTDDTNWIVELRDLDASGAEKLVTMGWLKASHRELDESKSKPYQPYHPHTRSIPVEPEKVCEYAIELRETSMVFKSGHRIELVIKGQDAPWEGKEYLRERFWHLPSAQQTLHTIFHNPEFPSHLLLPIIPPGR